MAKWLFYNRCLLVYYYYYDWYLFWEIFYCVNFFEESDFGFLLEELLEDDEEEEEEFLFFPEMEFVPFPLRCGNGINFSMFELMTMPNALFSWMKRMKRAACLGVYKVLGRLTKNSSICFNSSIAIEPAATQSCCVFFLYFLVH